MKLAFIYMIETNNTFKFKVLETRAHDYTREEVDWMLDPDFYAATAVYRPSVDLVDRELVFDTEEEALAHVARFYAAQVTKRLTAV